ncbi:MAG: peptidase D-aminopeptidase [Clostridia bacterium]|jgi:D-amino peptidase|nr:peptidase D-aminopeptidase [Clostridia bacterium]
MKKIYVSVDLEGIGGIVSTEQVGIVENVFYEEARRLMAGEANAIIEGINLGGGLAVIGDSHGNMLNIPIELLKGDFLLCCGSDKALSMMGGMDETYDGVMFLGYHARFGTPNAIMDHTYSPTTLRELRINGKPVGETEINAEVAGYFNVPVLLATGDDVTMEQLRISFPNIETVTVKKSIGRYSALCEPVDKVRTKIRDAARKVTENIESYGFLYKSKAPIKMEFDWNTAIMAEVCTYVPGVVRSGDRSTSYQCDDYIQAFKLFTVLRRLASSVTNTSYL